MQKKRVAWNNLSLKGLVAIVVSALAFGLSTAVTKHAMNQGIQPVSFALLSLLCAAVFLLPVYFMKKKNAFTRKDYRDFLVLGFLAGGVVQVLLYVGISLASAINVSLLTQVITLFTVVFAFFLLGERVRKTHLLAGGLMLFGALLVSSQGQAMVFELGDLFILGMSVLVGFTNVFAKKIMVRHHPVVVTFWRALIGIPFLFAFAVLLGVDPFSAFGLLVIINGFLTALTISALYTGFNHLGVSLGSILMLMKPLFGVSLAMLLLSESLLPVQAIGGLMIIIGALLITRSKRNGS